MSEKFGYQAIPFDDMRAKEAYPLSLTEIVQCLRFKSFCDEISKIISSIIKYHN